MRKLILMVVLIVLTAGFASAALVDNGDGTVTDTVTGLMWQKATAPGTYTWQAALDYAESLTLAGKTDWRLPDINELQTLVDDSTHSPAVYPLLRGETQSSAYWSATTYALYTNYAWHVYFFYGFVGNGHKSRSYYVRAVRAGQSEIGSFGSLLIFIEPAEARTAGAQWRRTGTSTWYNSGATESNVPTGEHEVEFKEINGWTRPDNIGVTIEPGRTISLTGRYSAVGAQHTVTATAGTGGSVTPSSHTVNHGSTASFTVTPDTNYTHGSVGGTCPAGSFSGNTYTTGGIIDDCEMIFSFVEGFSMYDLRQYSPESWICERNRQYFENPLSWELLDGGSGSNFWCHLYVGNQTHAGVDFMVGAWGTRNPIYTHGYGYLEKNGKDPYATFSIRHLLNCGETVYSNFLHNADIPELSEKTHVTKHQYIGIKGNISPDTISPHLHFDFSKKAGSWDVNTASAYPYLTERDSESLLDSLVAHYDNRNSTYSERHYYRLYDKDF